jgi:hypothetical protein
MNQLFHPRPQPPLISSMKANVGSIDRIIRIIVGLALLGAGYYFKTWWGLVGLGPILTAVIRFCPAYLPFGLSTCKTNAETPPKS